MVIKRLFKYHVLPIERQFAMLLPGLEVYFQHYFSYIIVVFSFIDLGKSELIKENHSPQITDKLYYIKLISRVRLARDGIRLAA